MNLYIYSSVITGIWGNLIYNIYKEYNTPDKKYLNDKINYYDILL